MNLAKILSLSFLLVTPLAACASTPAQRCDDLMAKDGHKVLIDSREDVISACGLDTTRAYFAYDSADLGADDKQLLADVGLCLTKGKLAGRSIIVIGYTDRRGEADYNLGLGMTRGESVSKELIARGVEPGHIVIRSRGEGWATGTTPDGRAYDRKVELRLMQAEN